MAVDYNEIGRNIKFYRNQRRLKQSELAEKTDVSSQHISHVEHGYTKLSLELLIKMSEALSVDLYLLLGSNIATECRQGSNAELDDLFSKMTKEQKLLCLELCRTVYQYHQ